MIKKRRKKTLKPAVSKIQLAKLIIRRLLQFFVILCLCFVFALVINYHFTKNTTPAHPSTLEPKEATENTCHYRVDTQCSLWEETQVRSQVIEMAPQPQEVAPHSSESSQEKYQQNIAQQVFTQKLNEIEALDKVAKAEAHRQVAAFTDLKKAIENSLKMIEEENAERVYLAYEEKLPDNIISDEPLRGVPVTTIPLLQEISPIYKQQKDITTLNIHPDYKPAYFGEKPVLAIVVDDMGISLAHTKEITSLKAPLTSSFLTYGRALDRQINNALAAGQEIMVHTPMEALSPINTAPDVLTTKMNEDEIKDGLNRMLDKFHDIKGINNHMGSRLTEDKERMGYVMEVLKERGLFFLDSKTSAKSVAQKAAQQNGVAYATRHVFLDNENKIDYINKQLALAERLAHRNGYAIAICHPKSQTYIALSEWLKTLPEKNIQLVPLSQIVNILNKNYPI